MSNPPAFQLYAADFYMDTISWSNEEIGIYFRLLMCEWVNGPLPFEVIKLRKICQVSPEKWQKKWPKISEKFKENGQGNLINIRLEKTREKAVKYIESQKESGKRGAEKKRELGIYPFNKSSEPLSDPSRQPLSDPPTQNQALQSSSSSSKDKRKNIKKEKPVKKSYREFVTLTDDEHKKLIDKFGIEKTDKILDKLNNAKGSKGYKYVSDYHAIFSWVLKEVEKEEKEYVASAQILDEVEKDTRTPEQQKAGMEKFRQFAGAVKLKNMD